jgi:PBSX family phage terminase large subunit
MILTPKHKQTIDKALKPSTRFLTFEGAAQNGKSSLAILTFALRVAKSKAELHCIAAKDLDAIRDNILEGDNKLLDLFGDHMRIVGGQMGSKYIEFITPNGNKKIILAGYSNKKTWEKILGKPIENFLIDEINIADEQFIYETMARQFSFDNPFTITTLNGDDPDHFIYDKYINGSIDLFPKDTPASTKAQMEQYEKKQGYYYVFFGLDDHPLMTPEKKQRIIEAYPVNSFYYQTKVLGVRGVQEGLLYADLVTPQHYVDWSRIDKSAIKQCEIGIDIGDKAETVFTLTGFTKEFSRALVIDTMAFNEADYDEIIGKFNHWLDQWYQVFGHIIKGVWVDSADSIFIRTLRGRISMPVKVYGSKKMTIKERVILKEQLLHQKRLLFVNDFSARDTALMLKKMKTDGKGGHLDEGKAETDYNDSLDYSLTPHLKKLSDYTKG